MLLKVVKYIIIKMVLRGENEKFKVKEENKQK